MKRKLTFLMLFMAFCSMISLGQNHWNPDTYAYNSSMTGDVIVYIDGIEQRTADLEVGAFCGDELRGSNKLKYTNIPPLNVDVYNASLTIYGESGNEITFKLYDHNKGQVLDLLCSNKLNFTENYKFGEITNPYVINFITPVAEVNGTVYGSLDAAIAAADANDEVKLLGDVTLSAELAITKVININLNDNEINGTVKLAIVGATITGTADNMTVTSGVEGYKAVYSNDVWALTAYNYVAQVGSNKYEKIQEAVNAASENATIVIIGDASDETVTVDKNLIITGSNVTLNNVAFNANGANELTVSGLSFTGNSWINSGTAEKLTVSGVTANVTPSNKAYTNSRSAFISLGRSEQQQLELYVTDCNIVANGGGDAILGWAAITTATLTGNTFGSETAYQTNSDCVKFMAIAQGAVFNITGNTIYSNYNGIVFGQNTTRDNAYTVNVDGNTFKGNADHIWIEISGGSTCHATIEATSNNTVNGNTFTYEDIKAHTDVIKSWTSYAGVDVVKNTDGKIIGGSFAHINELLIAEGYEFDEVKGTVIRSVSGEVAYRAYVHDNDNFEGVAVDLKNVYVKESLKVELFDANGNVLTTTTYAKDYPIDAESFSCLIVLDGQTDDYWNTVKTSNLTVANMPETIKVYVDGQLANTFNNALGAGTNVDETAKYKALDCVYKEAQIGTEYYATLADAVAAAQTGETVTMLADVTPSEQVVINKSIILDLNNKTITGTGATYRPLKVAGNNSDIAVTIKNGTVKTENVTTKPEQAACVLVYDGADVTFENVVMNGSNYGVLMAGYNDYATGVSNNNITSIVVNGENTNIKAVNAAIIAQGAYPNISIQINAGNVESTESIAIYQPTKGDLTINGGTITGSTAVYVKAGNLKVNGGTIIGNGEYADYEYVESGATSTGDAIVIESCNYGYYGAPTALIEGGVINSTNAAPVASYQYENNEQVKNFISGGTFNKEIASDLIAPGFKLEENADGTYGVVVDPAYGKVAKIDDTYYETLAEAIAAVKGMSGDVVIELVNDATLDYNAREAYGKAETTSLTINGNGKTLTLNQKDSDWSSFGLANAAAKVVFNNMTIEKTGYGDTSGAWNTHAIIFSSEVEMTNVTVNNSMAVQNGATLTNVTINEANGYYGLWINGNGQTVTMNGGSINATNGGRGIKIADQYIDAPALVTLSVTGTTFNTAKKAAVLVSSTAGAAIAASNVDITNVAEDKVNFAWVDEGWAAHYGEVTVTGGTVSQESVEIFNVTITDNNNAIQGYYKNIAEAIADAQAGETVNLLNDIEETSFVEINKDVTINGNGKTLTSSATHVIRLTASGINVTINELNMVSEAVRVGTNDVRGISIDIIDNVTLTLNNCSVDFTDASANDWAYAVNVTGGNEHNVTVNGGTYEGANVVNVHGANNTVIVKNATLTSLYPDSDMYYGATIWVLEENGSSVEATGNTFNGGNAVAFNIGTGTTLTESNNTDNTTVVVAKVDGTYYTSVNEAINAAADGATVQLLSRTISEAIAPWKTDTQHTTEKSITVKGYDNFGTTLTGGLYLGYDDSQCRNHTIVVEGIAFEGKGLTVACQKDVTINNNTFNNITDSRAIAVIGKDINATVKDNKIDGVQIGIELRNMAVATMTGNEVKNTTHNSVQVTAANPDADVTITGNTFENWGEGGEGRAIRVSGGDNIVINDNKMVNANAPESFVKITKSGETVQTINASQNYWNGKNPLALFETDGAADPVEYLNNYYADAEMQNLITLSASIAKVGNEYYQSLQAAVDAAQAGETVTLLVDATGAGVVIDKKVTIDFGGKTYTVNQAVGSEGTVTLGFQILKSNNVTLKNGTLTSTAVTSGKEVKMLIQNYANLTLTDMKLVDNTDHILYALSNNSGTSSIEGATSITTDEVAFDVYDYTAGGYAVPTVNVNTTGTIAGKIEVSESISNNLNISGGTFTNPIAEAWCADGFIPKDNGDGTYGVEKGVFVARVNGKGYTTFNAAIEAAQAGETVTILAGNYTQTLNINKAIIVEGERNDQNENLVNITGKLNITADGATAKNLNVNNGGNSAGYINAKDVTVDGCTVVGGNGFRSCYTTGLVTFKNSTITGSTYGIHFDGSAGGNIVIENCDITGWTSFASTITNVAITDTEFLNGNYNQLRFYQNSQMTNCKFNEEMTIDFGKEEVKAEFEGCAVVDTEGNATDAPLTNVIYLGDIAEMGIDITIDDETVVVESRITRVNGENEEHRYFLELTDALADVKDGETITLFADINEAVNVKTLGKEIVFDGNEFTMTAGMSFGNDDNNGDNGKITVKNVNFANANAKAANNGLTLIELAEVTVDNCNFTNITGDAIAVISDNLTETITITNNVIDGATGAGINLRTPKAATVKDNVIKNVGGNAMTFQHNSKDYDAEGDIIVTGNLMENWANNAAEGRAIRLASGSKARTFTIENNAMVKANAPEEFVKITTAEGAQTTISIDENYWNGQSPLNENVYLVEGVFPTNYYGEYQYANETLTFSNLVSINYVAQVNGVKYPSLAAAVEAAQAGETVTLLGDATGAGVVIDKNITIDFNGKTYTVNQAVGSTGTETLGFQILKDNDVTLKNGTLTSTAVTSGKEVKMLIQNYADLTLTDMTLIDNTGYIQYALSNNSGETYVNGETYITVGDGSVAFDVYDYTYGGYAETPVVYVNTTGTIAGKIEVSESISNDLNISGGTFTNPIVEAWCANGFIPKYNGDGTWTVKVGQYVARIGETGYEELDKAFAAAQDNDEVKILVAGTYALTTSGKDITITGAVDGVVFDNIGAKNMGGANVTFNNVTFDYYPNVNYTGLQHSGNLVYNNCTINGQVFLYGTSETFNECIFNQNSADAYNVWTYGAKDVDFIECTFNSVGKSVLIYAEGASIFNNVNVTECTFNASAPVDGKAAIEMDSSLTAGINLTIDDATTATGFDNGNVSGNSLWNNKKGNETEANNDITVVVNNETVLAPLTLVAAAGGTNYTSLQAAYNAVAANGTITILNDVTGAGLVIDKNVTIDFNEKTYTFNEGVGSGTLTSNGFQILQGNTVVLNNGKLEVAAEAADKFYILVQNYANLTVKDMNLDGTNLDKWSATDGDSYVLSNNSGTVNITGATNITANDEGDKAFAFDVCKYANYAVPIVNVNTTGIIAGKIEVSPEIPTNLNISGGTFYIDFLYEDWCAEYYSPVQDEQNSNIWTVELTGGELSRSFNKNWNWFSSYVDLSASDGSGVEKLQNALGTSGIQIKGRADGYVNYEAGEWHGSLSSILKGNMYMIKTSQAISEDGFKIAGTFVDHEEIAIELSYGWNWISYPVRESVGLSDALKDFNPKEGDQIKSYSNGFAQYSNNEWQGSLATMIPGQGYMYKSNNSTKYVYYNVPETGSRAALKANVTAEDNHWAPTSNYANNMTMIAMLNIDGEMSGNDYEIAAFANGECRGSARPIYVESVDAYMLFMTIYGEEVENLSFKYYDLNYGTEYELSDVVVYSDDAAVGSIEEPYMFNLDFLGVGETSFDEISIYPNPTTTKAEINLNATCEKVEVFNALGVKVAEYANVDTIDALETAGVYVIRITNNNDVKNCRLVVK